MLDRFFGRANPVLGRLLLRCLAVGAGAALSVVLGGAARWATRRYWIAENALFYTTGPFGQNQAMVDFARIDDVRVQRTFLDLLAGTGDVVVSAPTDPDRTTIRLAGVEMPYAVRDLLWRQALEKKKEQIRIDRV